MEGQIVNAVDFMSEIITPDTIYLLDHTDQDVIEFTTQSLLQAGEFEFVHGQKSAAIYLRPGTSLKMAVDYNLWIRSMTFEGATAAHNRYLQKKQLLTERFPEDKELYFMPVEDFMRQAEALRVAQMELLRSAKDSINDEQFYVTTKGNIEYEWANRLISYEHMHGLLTANKNSQSTDSLNSVLDGISIEKPDLLSSYRYVNYVFNKITAQANAQMAAKTFPAYMADYEMLKTSLALTNEKIENQAVQDRMEMEFLNHYQNFISTEQRDELTTQYGIGID